MLKCFLQKVKKVLETWLKTGVWAETSHNYCTRAGAKVGRHLGQGSWQSSEALFPVEAAHLPYTAFS